MNWTFMNNVRIDSFVYVTTIQVMKSKKIYMCRTYCKMKTEKCRMIYKYNQQHALNSFLGFFFLSKNYYFYATGKMEIKNKKNNFQYLKLCFCIIFCIYIENPLTRLGTVSKNDNCSIIKKKPIAKHNW